MTQAAILFALGRQLGNKYEQIWRYLLAAFYVGSLTALNFLSKEKGPLLLSFACMERCVWKWIESTNLWNSIQDWQVQELEIVGTYL